MAATNEALRKIDEASPCSPCHSLPAALGGGLPFLNMEYYSHEISEIDRRTCPHFRESEPNRRSGWHFIL